MVVVDEVSFLDHDRDLRKLSDRLQSFTQDREHKFGRYPIIFLGDFRQLCPVNGVSILQYPESMLWSNAINCMVELKGTHRFNKCGTLKEIMPALHKTGLSYQHREILNSRVIDGDSVKFPDMSEARIASFFNVKRCDHNRRVFRQYLEQHHFSDATKEIPKTAIVVKSSMNWGKSNVPLPAKFKKVVYEYCSDALVRSSRNEKCDTFLTLIHGAPVMGTKNKDVSNGVANGTCAKFDHLICKEGKSPIPVLMYGKWVYSIDIADVHCLVLEWTDSKFQGKFRIYSETGLFTCRYPVWNDNGNMHRVEQSMTIEHFPILMNYGTTGHKLQGKSLDCLVITEWSRQENWAYVVLSRVRTLQGLYLTEPIPFDIDFSPSPSYKEMMNKLEKVLATANDVADLLADFEAFS